MMNDQRARAHSLSRTRRTRPSTASNTTANRLPASQAYTTQQLHWRSAARQEAPRPKIITAWEVQNGDPRAAQVAALSTQGRRPSFGAHAGNAGGSSRPGSAAIMRPAYPPSKAMPQGRGGAVHHHTSAQHVRELAGTTGSAASVASTRVAGQSVGHGRPASATLERQAQSNPRVSVPATSGAIASGTAAHAMRALRPASAAAGPPGATQQRFGPGNLGLSTTAPRLAAAESDRGGVPSARRALSQPAWSPAELQQRSQYAGTIADDITRHYMLGRVLGTGSFGEVREATHRLTEESVAIKKIDKLKAGTQRLRTRIAMEIRLHQRLRHANVVHVFEVIEGARNVYVVMELCATTLLAHLKEKKQLSEAEARPLFAQLLSALAYCHRHNIVHRDIKLENVLLSADGVVKVADFGLAAELAVDDAGAPINMNAILRDVVGSQSYVAPEVLRRNGKGYMGPPADAWSCGVCLFTLLSGFFPLDVADSRDWRFRRLAAEQAQGRFTTCKSIFSMYQRPCPFSQEVQDVLDGLLRVDPQQRMTIDGALQAPFICTRPEEYLEVDADGDADADADGAVVYRTHFMPEPTPLAQPLASSMPVPMRQRAHKSSALAAFTGDGVSDTASRRHWFTMAAIGAGAILTVSGIAGRTRCAAA
mmetsp:Transcript_2392/g.6987  ORF Transcript_2392/g.6987 Transcript_2392/m.6987 type:complete len:651 (-) Transcript_2392:273-2225(-)